MQSAVAIPQYFLLYVHRRRRQVLDNDVAIDNHTLCYHDDPQKAIISKHSVLGTLKFSPKICGLCDLLS